MPKQTQSPEVKAAQPAHESWWQSLEEHLKKALHQIAANPKILAEVGAIAVSVAKPGTGAAIGGAILENIGQQLGQK